MGRVRGRDWVRTTFWDRNVDPGLTKYVDPGTCVTWQNHGAHWGGGDWEYYFLIFFFLLNMQNISMLNIH